MKKGETTHSISWMTGRVRVGQLGKVDCLLLQTTKSKLIWRGYNWTVLVGEKIREIRTLCYEMWLNFVGLAHFRSTWWYVVVVLMSWNRETSDTCVCFWFSNKLHKERAVIFVIMWIPWMYYEMLFSTQCQDNFPDNLWSLDFRVFTCKQKDVLSRFLIKPCVPLGLKL